MALGTYGTRIPATVGPQDVEIYYSYASSRTIDDSSRTTFTKIDSNLLTQCKVGSSSLDGMYNLRLPVQYFSNKGFYTLYIKPREQEVQIADVSTLSAYPDVRGIVLDARNIADSALSTKLLENNSLVGYRIIYIGSDGKKQNITRLVTSNNKCEPIVERRGTATAKNSSYRYNESGSLVFLTVTPSAVNTYNPNAQPFIGTVGQRILLVNTEFEPVCLDIEMTDHDIDTISTMLEGSQLRDLDNGLITTFNKDNEIYNQKSVYSLKDSETGEPIYEVLKNNENRIDFNQTITDK